MFVDQVTSAIETVVTVKGLDHIGRVLWRGLAENVITEDDAGRLSAAVEARRVEVRARLASPAGKPPGGAPGRPPVASRSIRSPDRRKSIERRRRQACSGIVPSRIASSFTPGEIATLTVIGREVQRVGVCAWPLDRIAAVAGVCRSTAQNAIREARRLGLISVQERRRRGLPSLTNIIRIVGRDWVQWLRLSGERGVGFKKLNPTGNQQKQGGLAASGVSGDVDDHHPGNLPNGIKPGRANR